MPTYNFWFKKTIKANNLNSALRREKKHELIFDSVVQEIETKVKSGADAIGFEYSPQEKEFYDYEI